ncbi:MAG: glycogen debranching protein GlgX [Nitrospirota bacterium]|nr:glycogen debranching protein GlgX [Nitrospirota bacterium]
MNPWAAEEGAPSPLGVTWMEDEQAVNFALYSKHATEVTLLLYAQHDTRHPAMQYRLDYLTHKSGRVWHCRIPAARLHSILYYAYRVDGPHDPAHGYRFDPEKVLLDPYAKTVFFPEAYSRDAARSAGSNAGHAPLGLVRVGRPESHRQAEARPCHASDTIIYELHVRGFTKRANSGVGPDTRGTFAGLAEKIPYLTELGITAVELLPVHQYDPHDRNYWGYMPLNFFSPHEGYAANQVPGEQVEEFRAMVKAFHAADIEVILDVCYNHTAEGDQNGPCYSFRGIDNTTYYLLQDDRRWYRNDTGTGNMLHCANRYVRKMIIESLRYWATEMGVDGFRFDLASIFTRNDDGSVNLDDPPIIAEISAHPDLSGLRLIAEAWDVASYQLGRSFPGLTWLQWNGQFRDDVRAFLKGDPGKVERLMTRLYGSDDLFSDRLSDAYHAYQSVNYVTAHDGFCLYDLVSYNAKHNDANGHGNQDGVDQNFSWNCGWEGDLDVPADVLALRKRQVKNFCALLLLANGTPMFCAGDEFMHTQGGNNNPYNQDNETTWLNWDRLRQNQDIFRFFKLMIAFRKRHPALARSRFWREDVHWHGVGAEPDRTGDSHSLAFFLSGASQRDDDIYVMINASRTPLSFVIQEGEPNEWYRVIDTSLPSPADCVEPGKGRRQPSRSYAVPAHSVVIFERANRSNGREERRVG